MNTKNKNKLLLNVTYVFTKIHLSHHLPLTPTPGPCCVLILLTSSSSSICIFFQGTISNWPLLFLPILMFRKLTLTVCDSWFLSLVKKKILFFMQFKEADSLTPAVVFTLQPWQQKNGSKGSAALRKFHREPIMSGKQHLLLVCWKAQFQCAFLNSFSLYQQ